MSHGEARPVPGWLQPTTDYVPLVVFLGVYVASDILTATAALIAASLAALAVSYGVARKVPILALLAAGVLAIFGGLTLVFADDFFIKIKPTIVQLLFSVVLFASLKLNRPVLKLVLGRAMELPDWAWTRITYRFCLFFIAMAALNEVVWRTQSTDIWVTFDTIGQMIITFGFVASQIPFLLRHQITQAEAGDQGDDRG